MGIFVDRTGHRYGRLLVISRFDDGAASRGKRVKWTCKCDCGNTAVVTGHGLQRGDTRSCGCLRREVEVVANLKHGKKKTPEYTSWRAARDRCNNPNHWKYPEYGGRGISFCKRWDDFRLFLADMGPRPDGHTLDRIDVDGDYSPNNCRWASPKQQASNRRRSRLFDWDGEHLCISEIARREKLPRTSINKAYHDYGCIYAAVRHVRR